MGSEAGGAQAPRLQRIEAPALTPPDAQYPLRLFTGRLMFDRGTIQRESAVLPTLAPEPFVEMHPGDAGRLGISDGDAVVVTTERGRLDLAARVTADVPPGTAFVPGGYTGAPVSTLWTAGARTVPCRVSRP